MKSLSSLKKNLIYFVVVIGFFANSHRIAKADYTFGTTTNLGATINSSYNDGTPCISHDGLSFYFASTRPGGVGLHDLWVATRASVIDEWSEPVHLGTAVNSWAQDYGLSISNDELTLYFRSNRSGGLGQGDIWVSTRSSNDAPWPAAVNAGSGINTSSDECMPCISADGLELYIGSTRPGGHGQDDLYMATRDTIDDPWSDPVNLGSVVNSGVVDACPSISPDGLMLFFNSTRNSGFGNYDLYVTTRTKKGDPWSTAVNLGETINTVDDEMTPSFWSDGSVIYFCSWADRPGGLGGADLWQAIICPVIDLNGDGIVDSADMCIIVDNWGSNEPLCDIGPMPWGDGIVDVEDLKVLAEHLFEEAFPIGLIGYWKLDETEGNIAYDCSGNHHTTLYGNPIWQPMEGKIDGALEFDGIDDYGNASFVLNPSSGPFSTYAWIKGNTPGQVIISQTDGTGFGGTWLGADQTDGKLFTNLMYFELASETVIIDDQWRHVGLVWNGSRRYLYVDKEEVARDTSDMTAIQSTGDLYLGADKNLEATSFFSGLIDDVRIYNRVVSP